MDDVGLFALMMLILDLALINWIEIHHPEIFKKTQRRNRKCNKPVEVSL